MVALACGCLDVNPLFVDPTGGPDEGTGQATTTGVEPTSTPGPTSDTVSPTVPTTDTNTTLIDETTAADPTSGATTDASDTEAAACGDGIAGPNEACDDGNQVDDDGCSNECTLSSVCGDAEVEGPEECDDGNVSELDSCDNLCKHTQKLVFVTSLGYIGDLGGLAGADQICLSWAADAGLPEGVYLAWLSDAQAWPAMRMSHHPGPYILPGPDKPVVALGWDDLTDGTLAEAIDRDAFAQTPPPTEDAGCSATGVMTNTDASGEPIGVDELNTCFDWYSAEGFTTWGSTVATNEQWTDNCSANMCGFPAPFICVQQ